MYSNLKIILWLLDNKILYEVTKKTLPIITWYLHRISTIINDFSPTCIYTNSLYKTNISHITSLTNSHQKTSSSDPTLNHKSNIYHIIVYTIYVNLSNRYCMNFNHLRFFSIGGPIYCHDGELSQFWLPLKPYLILTKNLVFKTSPPTTPVEPLLSCLVNNSLESN